MKSFHFTLGASFLLLFLNGCSVLFGSVKPVEEKAVEPNLVQVQNLDPHWKKLEIKSEHEGTPEANEDIPDAAWQSNDTAAVISLNSACRQFNDVESNLQNVTNTITTPWNNLQLISQKETTLNGYRALETIAEGYYLNRERKFQLVVVKSSACIYDLIFLSQPKTYDQEVAVFQRFRDSLKLK